MWITFEIMLRARKKPLPALGLGVFLLSTSGFACSVCYGDPSSPMVQGAKAGVLFLAGLVYAQLMLMGAVAVYWFMRARRINRERRGAEAGITDPGEAPSGLGDNSPGALIHDPLK